MYYILTVPLKRNLIRELHKPYTDKVINVSAGSPGLSGSSVTNQLDYGVVDELVLRESKTGKLRIHSGGDSDGGGGGGWDGGGGGGDG